MKDLPIKLSHAVKASMADGKAILAMESTVITHGLPYPQNFEILSELEALAMHYGAVPATICVLDGICHIGLDAQDLSSLEAKVRTKSKLNKLARRDLAWAFANNESGGTTVSATMALAHIAGIKVFATGGIGGVHRSWQETLDISNDLFTLAEIPVIVVSAGSKAILDIPASLEALEALGVPVYGWGVDVFPAFYSRDSRVKIAQVDSLSAIAAAFRYALKIAPKGILIANPIPKEDEISVSEIEPYIQEALKQASGLSGKQLTPFLLDYLAKATQGRSVRANLALLKNNVVLGAKIAGELI